MKIFIGMLVIMAAIATSIALTATFHFSPFEAIVSGILIGGLGGKLGATIMFS